MKRDMNDTRYLDAPSSNNNSPGLISEQQMDYQATLRDEKTNSVDSESNRKFQKPIIKAKSPQEDAETFDGMAL